MSVADPVVGHAADADELSMTAERVTPLRILVVDDDRSLREGCVSILQVDGHQVTAIGRGDEALELLGRRNFDLALVDLYMTPVPGMEILKGILASSKDTVVIMMTGNPSVATNLEALRIGAWDYLPKPFAASHLQLVVGRAAHAVKQRQDTGTDRQPVRAKAKMSGQPELLGSSRAFLDAVELARKVASTSASVMITGESGTGKEMIAQFIHEQSRRSGKAMVAINCAALPEQLLESEMFGHRKGAFTGADRDKPGLLEAAHEGTLFLDELTEMSLPLQAKLLRVIQDGVVRRVGSEQPDAIVNVRFISATNRDPQEAVRSGVLREDLFYRLRVVPIKLPPLRQRVEDVPVLATHFLAHYWARHRMTQEAIPRFSAEALEFLRSRPWMGNVRELQNTIEHLAVLTEPGHLVTPADIPVYDDGVMTARFGDFPSHLYDDVYHSAKEQLLAHFEQEYVRRLVARAGGNMSRAARMARIDRTTLYRLIEKYDGKRSEEREQEVPRTPEFGDRDATDRSPMLGGSFSDSEVPLPGGGPHF